MWPVTPHLVTSELTLGSSEDSVGCRVLREAHSNVIPSLASQAGATPHVRNTDGVRRRFPNIFSIFSTVSSACQSSGYTGPYSELFGRALLYGIQVDCYLNFQPALIRASKKREKKDFYEYHISLLTSSISRSIFLSLANSTKMYIAPLGASLT